LHGFFYGPDALSVTQPTLIKSLKETQSTGSSQLPGLVLYSPTTGLLKEGALPDLDMDWVHPWVGLGHILLATSWARLGWVVSDFIHIFFRSSCVSAVKPLLVWPKALQFACALDYLKLQSCSFPVFAQVTRQLFCISAS